MDRFQAHGDPLIFILLITMVTEQERYAKHHKDLRNQFR